MHYQIYFLLSGFSGFISYQCCSECWDAILPLCYEMENMFMKSRFLFQVSNNADGKLSPDCRQQEYIWIVSYTPI